jgi:hypothetical protein
MLEALAIVRDGDIIDQRGYENCLRCHSVQPAASQRSDDWKAGEAVSCEACHGPSQRWLRDHAQRDWQHERRSEFGMLNTTDLLIRARICTECHVGSPDREVNHDMIAAGHPALRFEMSADHARLPKHWRDSQENTPQFEWSLWLAGQIASADAALSLSHARLSNASAYGVWPEFAEFNCGDCHHALDVPTARHRPAYKSRSFPRWGDWTYTYLGALSENHQTWKDLSQKMTQSFGQQDAALVGAPSQARNDLNAWIAQQQQPIFSADTLDALSTAIEPLLGQQATAGVASWEEAAQVYLALRARDSAGLRAVDPVHPRLQMLERMRATLRFDEELDFRVFFSAAESAAIPYDRFQQELQQYLLSGSQ